MQFNVEKWQQVTGEDQELIDLLLQGFFFNSDYDDITLSDLVDLDPINNDIHKKIFDASGLNLDDYLI